MKIRDKIILMVLTVVIVSGIMVTSVWYHVSRKMTSTYLNDISQSTMQDAKNAFEYILTDTSYMITMISLNEDNIVKPVKNLASKELKKNGQWNMEYLENKRVIDNYIASMNGYKYYIVGITVVVSEECIFNTSYYIQDHHNLYERIQKLDENTLKTKMVMMDPIHVEGGKATLSSDYVIPAVRGILDNKRNLLGYVVLYFDYDVIEKIFASNLPDESHFQVVNANQSVVFSNYGESILDSKSKEKNFVYNEFLVEDINWKFIMELPTDYYLNGLYQTTLITGIVLGTIFIVAAVIITIVVSKMTVEITKLRNSMHQVANGNLKTLYEVTGGDEIGQIGESFNYMVQKIGELMEKVVAEEKKKRMIEISFLQAQINPHFVSNILNIVIWMAKIQNANNIVPLVQSLNVMLQNVMHQEEDLILLENELEYVENYLTIVEYCGVYDCMVEKKIEKETEKLYVLRFILQPILENAVKHGMPDSLEKQEKIFIHAYLEESKLKLIIEDNGNGMTQQQIEQIMAGKSNRQDKFSGIGIQNVRERIKLFFGEEYGLNYESKVGEYTRAVFTLPIVKER